MITAFSELHKHVEHLLLLARPVDHIYVLEQNVLVEHLLMLYHANVDVDLLLVG